MTRFLVLATLALATVTCGNPVGPRGTAALTLTASVSSATLAPGQADTMTVTLTNTSRSAITLHFGSGCQVLPYVVDDVGMTVLPAGGGWYCLSVLSSLSLRAGEQQHFQYVWRSTQPGAQLPPGTYFAYATIEAREGKLSTQHIPVSQQ